MEADAELARFTKATKLTAWDGPVFVDGYGYNEGYFESVNELLEYLEHRADLDGIVVPAYAWTCTSTQFVHPSMDDIESQISDCAHENWDSHDLEGVDELKKALDTFTEANKHHVLWEPDFTHYVLIASEESAK